MSKIYEALLRAELERLSDDDPAAAEASTESSAEDRAESAASAPLVAEARPYETSTAVADLPMPAPGFAEAQTLRGSGEAAANNRDSYAPLPQQDSYITAPAAAPAASVAPSYTEPAPTNPASVISDAVTGTLPGIASRPWSPSLDVLPALAGRGGAAEQFRSLRSRLYDYRGFNKLKTVLVSSSMEGEGKSYIASNLAISLARHRSTRVLLIDGDLRRCSLHTTFGTTAEPGLSNYLTGRATALQIMQRAEAVSGEDLGGGLANLTLIAGGNQDERSADLSGNPRFQELLQFATPYFDWVIVDSSPVGLVSDAVNLGRSCDGVLLVVREGVTRYEAAQRAVAEFQATPVLGVVLNASTNAPALSYYGYSGTDTEQK